MKKPIVSVIIPTMPGREAVLKRAIWSVIHQTYTNVQLIVISDDTISASAARNRGVVRATGKYIAFLDDDDEWQATKLQKQVEYMETHSECELCTCGLWDKRFGRNRISMPQENPTFTDLITAFNYSSTSSYMVRTYTLLRKRIYFKPKLKSGQEFDLALYLALAGNIHTIQQVLGIQHSTQGQISCNWEKKITGQMQFYKIWHRYFSLKSHMKTVGMLTLFTCGYVFGNKIYKIINYVKAKHEGK